MSFVIANFRDVAEGLQLADESVVNGAALTGLDPAQAPLSTALGVVGIPGLRAYVGLKTIGEPKEGETVVVSAASGAVGGVAGQLARRDGCRVVGIASGAGKCRHVSEELGFDGCVDHRGGDLGAALEATYPKSIDCLFRGCRQQRAARGFCAAQRFRPPDHVRHDRRVQRHRAPARPKPCRCGAQAP
jgi:NADPH-dependent curcumin reductase CurA